jgi:hypothetical protein
LPAVVDRSAFGLSVKISPIAHKALKDQLYPRP